MRPYLRAANVTWQGICLDDVNEMNFDDVDFEKFRLTSGDILLNEASGSPHEVGKPAIWNNQIEGCCFQNTLLRLRPQLLNRNYIYWHCYASALMGRFGEAGRGVNIRHLGKRGLAQFPIPVAPLAEQERIVAAIEEHFARLDAVELGLRRGLQQLDTLKSAVLVETFPLQPQLAVAVELDDDRRGRRGQRRHSKAAQATTEQQPSSVPESGERTPRRATPRRSPPNRTV